MNEGAFFSLFDRYNFKRICIFSKDKRLKACLPLQIARTPIEKEQGMMFKTGMDYVLAFPYSNIQTRGMWMKNVKFPLDMVFCKYNSVVQIQPEVPDCTILDCPTIESIPSNLVLELPGGWSSKLQLRIGDQVDFTF